MRPFLLTWFNNCASCFPSINAGWSEVRDGLFYSTSLRNTFKLSSSIESIDFLINYRILMFLINLLASSNVILNVPLLFWIGLSYSFIFSSEMIY